MKIFTHPRYLEHVQYSGHPERPERLTAILSWLEEHSVQYTNEVKPAERRLLEKVHTATYIDFVQGFEGYMDPDTYIHKETFEIASLAVGGTLQAVQHAMSSNGKALALVRPPGHHAGQTYGCGFCYFNNVALAAHLLTENSLKVAIVDIDVHHGNGTSDIFFERRDVLYISTHQWGIFPGTGRVDEVGAKDGEGYTLNIPFAAGAGDASFRAAANEIIMPVLMQFQPDIIIVSLGADAHYMDPLGGLSLSSTGYHALCMHLIECAEKVCSGRIAFSLEGGYHLQALAEVVGSIALGKNFQDFVFNEIYDEECNGREVLERVKEVHAPFWTI